MNYKVVPPLFLSLFFAILLGYASYTAYKVWSYLRLNQQTEVQKIQWSILERSDEEYVPFAHYEFQVNEETFQGQTKWSQKYLNEWTAKEAITRLKNLSVWYNTSSPNISSLQKNFPLKEVLYAFLLGSMGVYFIFLRRYIQKKFTPK